MKILFILGPDQDYLLDEIASSISYDNLEVSTVTVKDRALIVAFFFCIGCFALTLLCLLAMIR